ncbi:PR domain zinc finger protein 8-like [Protopterus annectens]|uniref:PR domain zinc finger protein 8-like n=1 Tax=Protopterus annectens TaxID=7888 RepID=UPI001CF95379|nr:PR domain zinc finger protein 8-like [Protopterus annectens]
MEIASLSKTLWTSDPKLLHQHFTDVLTSVHTTQDIPEGTVLGPFILQNTIFDTIAFIALKCTERRSIPYVFRVDTAMLNNPSYAGLPWLRLVQAAVDKKEQNLEAYLKNGQLYYRATRKIVKEEELFVWYDEELSALLGFQEIKARNSLIDFKCPECDQLFKYENPYLAHIRFLCTSGKDHIFWKNLNERRTNEVSSSQKVTNFHNLARDLEDNARTSDLSTAEKKRKLEQADTFKIRKPVLLEKTNSLNNEHTPGSMGEATADQVLAASVWKLSSGKHLFGKDPSEQKCSAFTEVKRAKDSSKQEQSKESEHDRVISISGSMYTENEGVQKSTGSAFSLVWPTSPRQEQKSAFMKPTRQQTEGSIMGLNHSICDPAETSVDISGHITSPNIPGYNNLVCSKYFGLDLANTQMILSSINRSNPLPYATELWPKSLGAHLQTTSSLTLLPPSFTSYGVAAQNWCAKCNLSFRMTSDLVFHMRSHHKKEYALDSQCKRRREEKLTCPICKEYFRERHHLSRHMTSHN